MSVYTHTLFALSTAVGLVSVFNRAHATHQKHVEQLCQNMERELLQQGVLFNEVPGKFRKKCWCGACLQLRLANTLHLELEESNREYQRLNKLHYATLKKLRLVMRRRPTHISLKSVREETNTQCGYTHIFKSNTSQKTNLKQPM